MCSKARGRRDMELYVTSSVRRMELNRLLTVSPVMVEVAVKSAKQGAEISSSMLRAPRSAWSSTGC